MNLDLHERARFLMEEERIAGIPAEDARWLRGHVAECAECARRAESWNAVLRGMNGFAFDLDPAAKARLNAALQAQARRPRHALRWVLAAAAVFLAAAVPVFQYGRQAQREQSDALLMEQVESRLQRPVPLAMEPLIVPRMEESK
jgi:hypothetical protein